ncbi:hypothetical protein IIC65_05530, partial [Candidatus Sumerlaeota bacterium]|nr:hypothetical protein [Candidatus Sumerlaeota bacterium]
MVIAALYLQSSHAFAHLWLPIVARAVDGEIAVERGKISLLGKISLEGLVFTDGQGRGVFRADSLFVHCSLLSLISGSVPLLRTIELQNPDLVALFALGGGSKESGDDGDGEGKPSRWEGPLLPVGIQRLVVRGLSFRWVDGEETRVAVSNGEITIDGLVPGETGTLTIEGELAVAPDDPARARSGRFDLTLSIEQNEDGSNLKWNGAGSAIARDVSADASASGTSDLRFDSKFEGSLSGLDSLASIASLAASQDGTQVGGIKTSLQWSSRGVRDGPSLDAKIEIEAIRPEFLNPLLAALGPA